MSNIEAMFASAERADIADILRDTEELNRIKLVEGLINEVPSSLMVLNNYLQVVFMNQGLIDLIGISAEEILGKRTGEIISCIHECEARCGTTEYCSECGAARVILEAHKKKAREETDFRVTTGGGDSLDYKIWASPYFYNNKDYTIISLMDTADEKRRQALEHTFLHGVNNTLSVILKYSQMIVDNTERDKSACYAEMISVAAKSLLHETESQSDLTQAESGELSVELSYVNSMDILDEITLIFSENDVWHNRIIMIGRYAEEFNLCTDRSLLNTVLVNMIKNALEATSEGDSILLTSMKKDGECIFSVNNPSIMPRPVQLQVFQRSFSTKGIGRGLGTYSMKLFGEKYLKGRVWFSSSEEEGTTFNLSMPIDYLYLSNAISIFEQSYLTH